MAYADLNFSCVPTGSKACYHVSTAPGVLSQLSMTLITSSQLLLPECKLHAGKAMPALLLKQGQSCLHVTQSSLRFPGCTIDWDKNLSNLRQKCTLNPNNYSSFVLQKYKVLKLDFTMKTWYSVFNFTDVIVFMESMVVNMFCSFKK